LEADRKFIVFAHHVEMLDAIHRLLDSKSVRFIRIDGKTPSDQRQVVCERFQLEEACKVALLSITAAGTGESGLNPFFAHPFFPTPPALSSLCESAKTGST
uniref:Helicase C-terminal domain-containing protein n=1 Tax=Schistocephalus solidus TaxID=70667 RepID=A0A183S9H6_SCHSO